jgi:NitT/TauT family transport system substrate-binding protein
MKHMGIKVRWLWAKDAGCDGYMALDTSDRFLAAHPDEVRAFVAATIRGWRGYLTEPGPADAEILRRNPAMNQLQLDLSRQVMIDYHLVDGNAAGTEIGDVDPKRIDTQYHILRDLGIISHEFDYHAAYTRDYLPRGPN